MVCSLRSILLGLGLAFSSAAHADDLPWAHGPLQVTSDGNFIQHHDGTPFFWLADTGWLLAQKLDRSQIDAYFEDRKSKGFNVVQTVVFQMLEDKTVYGDTAVLEKDISRLNMTAGSNPEDPEQYDYWDHVDYLIASAEKHGIYIAIAPVWSHTVRRTPITAAQAEAYISVLAKRWKDKPNVIWLNGGSAKGNESSDVWETIGRTIEQEAPDQLIAFHPFGRSVTATWFRGAKWLDIHMFVSGHRRYDQDVEGRAYGEDNWRYVAESRALDPTRPVIDAEPAYENTPQGLHDASQPYWTAGDARRYAYWSVFAGAAGHTYGENSVRQVYLATDPHSASGAKGYFADRLQAEGSKQMGFLKALLLSRPYYDRRPDDVSVADQGQKYERVLVARGERYAMAYTATGRSFSLALGRISGDHIQAWWFNPRLGTAQKIGTLKNAGQHRFDPPGDPGPGNDWVLVLDDEALGASSPGELARLEDAS